MTFSTVDILTLYRNNNGDNIITSPHALHKNHLTTAKLQHNICTCAWHGC